MIDEEVSSLVDFLFNDVLRKTFLLEAKRKARSNVFVLSIGRAEFKSEWDWLSKIQGGDEGGWGRGAWEQTIFILEMSGNDPCML